MYCKKHEGTFFYIITEKLEVTIYNRYGILQDEKEFNYKLKEISKEEQSTKVFNSNANKAKSTAGIIEYIRGEETTGSVLINDEIYFFNISPELDIAIYNRVGTKQNSNELDFTLIEISKEVKLEKEKKQRIENELNFQQSSASNENIIKASPKEGIKSFYQSFMEQVNVPNYEKDSEIKVVVKMVVDVEGNLTNFKIVNKSDANEPFEIEFLRVLKTMPKWNPATQEGKPISSDFYLPITLRNK